MKPLSDTYVEETRIGFWFLLNPQHLKGSLLVFVEISLDYKSGDTFEEFRRAVLKLPHVLECHLVSGDFDYLGPNGCTVYDERPLI